MPATTHEIVMDGQFLQRGFWLYIWEIKPQSGTPLYYVGRTGDSSSVNAQSPFNRMGQHLGFNEKSNVLRRKLKAMQIDPVKCTFRLVAHGPISAESAARAEHVRCRDQIAALEKALADEMKVAGYGVMNTVFCSKPLDRKQFVTVHAAFGRHFPQLLTRSPWK